MSVLEPGDFPCLGSIPDFRPDDTEEMFVPLARQNLGYALDASWWSGSLSLCVGQCVPMPLSIRNDNLLMQETSDHTGTHPCCPIIPGATPIVFVRESHCEDL